MLAAVLAIRVRRSRQVAKNCRCCHLRETYVSIIATRLRRDWEPLADPDSEDTSLGHRIYRTHGGYRLPADPCTWSAAVAVWTAE